MIWLLTGIILLPLAAGLLYLACLDGSYRVRRSLEIDAPLDSVFSTIVDFKTWPAWSPWLMHEPETVIVYSDNYQSEDGYYSWEGKVVGAGKMTHVEIRPGRSILQRIEFLKPFRSSSDISWSFERQDERTLLSWEMNGAMPFFFRFMAKRMEPMIGRDYELGLALLGGYLNPDMPHPRLQFDGVETLEDFSYWAIPCNGNLRQVEAARRGNIDNLRNAAQLTPGMSLTLYRQFDVNAAQYQAEHAIPIGDNPPLSNYQRRKFDGGTYYRMTLQGDLKYLPLAWYALACHCRMHKLKTEPTRPALEIYQQDPGELDNVNTLLTTLYLPVRGTANSAS